MSSMSVRSLEKTEPWEMVGPLHWVVAVFQPRSWGPLLGGGVEEILSCGEGYTSAGLADFSSKDLDLGPSSQYIFGSQL